MNVTIREARQGDEAALAKLADQLGYPVSPASVLNYIESKLDRRRERIFVAECTEEHETRIAGWCSAALTEHFYTSPCVEISGFVIDAAHRGQGIGHQLMKAVEAWTRDSGYDEIRLRANVIREQAHHFYEQQGFIRVKQQIMFRKKLG